MPPMSQNAEQKSLQVVAVFATTSDAMAVDAAADAGLVPGRMIPLPACLSAGCGLAWSVPAEEGAALKEALEREGLAYESLNEVMLA